MANFIIFLHFVVIKGGVNFREKVNANFLILCFANAQEGKKQKRGGGFQILLPSSKFYLDPFPGETCVKLGFESIGGENSG